MNRRKRGRAKRPTKASVAASGVASGDGSGGGPTGAAAVSAATGSALSQRRKYIMNLSEARSIGKRPSPMFTNFCYFKAQDARVLPLERLPAAQVRLAGKQGCGAAIVGMVYPRLTTSSEAVARLALEPLKWRGMLENCVSIAQARPWHLSPRTACLCACCSAVRDCGRLQRRIRQCLLVLLWAVAGASQLLTGLSCAARYCDCGIIAADHKCGLPSCFVAVALLLLNGAGGERDGCGVC